jgi:hypothetical protein
LETLESMIFTVSYILHVCSTSMKFSRRRQNVQLV